VARAVGRLVALVALGFGAGFLIGLVSEEPELLIGHLRGQSESVDLAEVETDPGSNTGPDAGSDAAPDAGPVPMAALRPARPPVEGLVERAEATAPPAASPPEVSAAAPSAPSTPPRADEPAPAATPVRAPAPAWAIQVGAFADEKAARGLAEDLGRKGYPVEMIPSSSSGGRWRVRVQPVAGEKHARQMADRLKREERLPTWVLPVEARPGS